jgi:hypothetical protein
VLARQTPAGLKLNVTIDLMAAAKDACCRLQHKGEQTLSEVITRIYSGPWGAFAVRFILQ